MYPILHFVLWYPLVFSLRIVFIGGGNGLSTVLKGFRDFEGEVYAVVTVFDSGGSSGIIKKIHKFFPPGDIRRCLASLARNKTLAELFNYRFDEYLLKHSLGNLILLALSDLKGGFVEAIREAEKILDTNGHVLPVSLDQAELLAEFEDGFSVLGEDEITKIGDERKKRIKKLTLVPGAKLYDGVRDALEGADGIVIGPGSLYTSILPNFLVDGMVDAIKDSNAVKIFAVNISTQPGETDEYTAYDHYIVLKKYLGTDVDVVLVNNRYLENEAAQEMFKKGWRYTKVDTEKFEGVELYLTDLVDESQPWRHDPSKFKRAILNILKENSII